MRQNSYEIGASQKKLRLIAGDHYIALPMKIKKADVKAKLNADEVLEAGTLITKDGKIATTTSNATNAYGILYQDVSFKGSMSADGVADNAYEVASIFLHGAVYESEVKLDASNAEVEKKALPLIIFGK
ncbi:MAG: hypothetical protein MSA56_12335 [Clostridium sp.]|nr:hypothetical protein [Clostridium sp.]